MANFELEFSSLDSKDISFSLGGAGGRIAIYANSSNFLGQVTAFTSSSICGPGTVFYSIRGNTTLVIDNGYFVTNVPTPIVDNNATMITLDVINVGGYAEACISDDMLLQVGQLVSEDHTGVFYVRNGTNTTLYILEYTRHCSLIIYEDGVLQFDSPEAANASIFSTSWGNVPGDFPYYGNNPPTYYGLKLYPLRRTIFKNCYLIFLAFPSLSSSLLLLVPPNPSFYLPPLSFPPPCAGTLKSSFFLIYFL